MKLLPVKGSSTLAKVDDDIFKRIRHRQWRLIKVSNGAQYVGWKTHEKGKDKTVYLHRLVMGFPKGQVDHREGDIFDNRREMLRVVTHSQNQMNSKGKSHSSRYKGVYWMKRIKKWKAQIAKDGKSYFLGYFEPHQERPAAYAYNFAALDLFGEHARLNFSDALVGMSSDAPAANHLSEAPHTAV